MRIAFVEHKLSLKTGGGSNVTIHQLASGLTELGHDVTVVTVSPAMNSLPPSLPYRVVEERLSDSYLDAREKLSLVRLLRRLESEADVFQIEAPSLVASAGLYRRLGGKTPVVARLHNYGFFCTHVAAMNAQCFRHCSLLDRLRHRPESALKKVALLPLRALEHYAGGPLARGVDRFLAPSPAVGEIHSWYGIDAARVVVLPPALDYAGLAARPRTVDVAARDAGGPFTIVYAGRLTREKGVDVLLEAVAGLDFAFTLELLGDGPDRPELEAAAQRLGVASAVRFLGWVSQESVAERLLAAHLFVHPVRWPEPGARAVADAMALGLPLVVADLGGSPWLAGDAALTFEPENPADLCEKISAVYRDPAMAARMSDAGRDRAQEYDRQRVLARLLSVYREVGAPLQPSEAAAASAKDSR